MKIEIVHDTLARRVYEKSSAEDKMRLKIANFIAQRYQYYLDSNKRSLLKREDLNYIEHYVGAISLSDDELLFIKKSKNAIKRRWIINGMIIAAILLGSLIYGQLMRVYKNQEAQLKDLLILKQDTLQYTQDSLLRTLTKVRESNDFIEAIAKTLKVSGNNRDDIINKTAMHIAELEHSKRTIDSLNHVLQQEIERKTKSLNQKEIQCASYMNKIAGLSDKIGTLEVELEKERKLNRGGGGTTTISSTPLSEASSLNTNANRYLTKDPDKAFHLALAAYERLGKSNDKAAKKERDEAMEIIRKCATSKGMDYLAAKNEPEASLIRKLSDTQFFGKKWTEEQLKPYLK